MPPVLKKKKVETSAPSMPPWHPDFRNAAHLPDTKVVRTAFFVNGASVLLALVLLLFASHQLYQLRELTQQLDEWERQIARDRPASAQAVALYKKFQIEAARVTEVDGFVRSKPLVSEIILRIAETLPANIALDRFDLRDMSVGLRATVRGAPEHASGYVSTYLQQLQNDTFFGEKFSEIKLVGLNREARTGRLVLEMTLVLKDAKKS